MAKHAAFYSLPWLGSSHYGTFDFSAIPRKSMLLELAMDMQGPRLELWQRGREEMERHDVYFSLFAFGHNENFIKLRLNYLDNIIGATISFRDYEQPSSQRLARVEFIKTRLAGEDFVRWKAIATPPARRLRASLP